MLPSAATGTTTRLAMVWPAVSRLRLDDTPTGAPVGTTVTKPGAVASVAVTLATTAATPAGTPAVPLTPSTNEPPAASLNRSGGTTGAVGASASDSHGMLLPSPSRPPGSP